MKKLGNSKIYLHGYEMLRDFGAETGDVTEPANWENEFQENRSTIETAIRIHDPISLLSRTATQCTLEGSAKKSGPTTVPLAALEILQATFLMQLQTSRRIPPSPHSLLRTWKAAEATLESFIGKQKADRTDPFSELANRTRAQTLHYRFIFDREVCLIVVDRIATKFDQKTKEFSELRARFRSIVKEVDKIAVRLGDHYDKVQALLEATTKEAVQGIVDFYVDVCPLAAKTWKRVDSERTDLETLRNLAFQLTEISHEWIFTINSEGLSELEKDTFKALSHRPGDLFDQSFEHLFMNNPVWNRPFIETASSKYFTALPQIPFAFPFRIIESLIPEDRLTAAALSDARAEALEELIFEVVSKALPSATVIRSLQWKDPTDGKIYEHDTVAILGNQIFIFEAKSGKIREPARRGGPEALKKTLRELFVEPAEQSMRMQAYLNEYGPRASLWEKTTGKPVLIDLTKPKAVYRFGITIEGLASLTAGRRFFERLGMIDSTTKWAPSISLGELFMISKYLDSEVSFGHYLSRRYTLEEVLDFIGDEQDLLSMYLTNGFCVLGEGTRDQTVLLFQADDLVRTTKIPREDRANSALVGVSLPPRWKLISDEVYAGHPSIDRHKFDILFTIMNQPPPALAKLQSRISRWRSGGGGRSKQGEHSKYVINDRQFVVLINLMDRRDLDRSPDIAGNCRVIAYSVADGFVGTTDCVVMTIFRDSKTLTYDGISFFRVKSKKSSSSGYII
ncbi:hypothetical protein [Tabrizicola sp.]|uniref:hypothetical protein n=1 Tax=Tabrizicola sp. TaxID=2005166 RepID=UPI0025EE78F8|nr:hypothetical protein [Tabrizicola sp.]